MKFSVDNLIDLSKLKKSDFDIIFKLAKDLKRKQKQGVSHKLLKDKTLAMLFEKSSTRTRVSFETGMTQLGGHAIFLGKNDIQMGRGETVSDTARTLSRYVDLIMARTFSHDLILEMEKIPSVPVINGLTDYNHPCQVLADLFTVIEKKGNLKKLKFAFVGDGNNVCNSFINASKKLGFSLIVATPKGYEPALSCNLVHDPKKAVKNADVVVTDTWISMGDEKEKAKRLKAFKGFIVDSKLVSLAKKDYIFLHCLPAYRGYEVSANIIDGKHSVVWQEAENRLHVQKAIMALLAG